MKLIAQKDPKTFIAEVSTTELRELHNLSYMSDFVEKLKVGVELNLSEAHNFNRDILESLKKHKELIESNAKVVKTLNKGFHFLCDGIGDGEIESKD